MKSLNKLTVVAFLLLLGACSGGEKPNVELIQDMMESPAWKAQEGEMRVPPANTVPVGFKPYKFKGDPEASSKNPNPMANDFSESTLAVGQKYYNIHCAVCHGDDGKGMGPVADKMPLKPPSLVSDKMRGWTDGRLYHVIHDGQGVMGPYASHIAQEEWRWAVVNYIRSLQKQAGK